MSEPDFFAEEAKQARAALRNLVKQTGERVLADTDIRPLIQERPWVSILAAAGGGLVAGYLITPPRLEPEEKKKRRRERRERKKKSSGGGIQQQLSNIVTPAIRTFAATAAGALFHNFQQGASEPQGNGQQASSNRSYSTAETDDQYASIPGQRIQI